MEAWALIICTWVGGQQHCTIMPNALPTELVCQRMAQATFVGIGMKKVRRDHASFQCVPVVGD